MSASMSVTSPNFEPATAILATLLLDDRQTFDQNSSQRSALKKTLISHGGIATQIQKYFQRLETRNYRVTSVVDDTHSPPTDKRLVLVPEKGAGRDSGIEDGRQSSVSSVFEHQYMRTVLTHKEFSVYKHSLLCAQYPVLGRHSRPNSRTSNASSAHHNLLSPTSTYSSHSPCNEDDDEEEDTDYPVQTETLSAVVRGAFQLKEERHLYYDKNIMEGLGWKAPAKVLVEELVSRLALLERNRHPFYQPQAFDTRNAYDFWQQQDRIRISELINKFWYFALPSPASSLCKPSYWESMHEEYADLMHKLIRYDRNQAMSPGSLLSSASRRLLKEFGLRYGVGEVYRRIVYLMYLAEKDNFDSEVPYLEHVCKQLAGLRDLLMLQQARFTMVRVEFDMLCETLSKLQIHCGDWLQRLLQDTHSPDRVGSLANLLCSVLELKVNLTGKKQTPVEQHMQLYIQESLKQAYHSQKLRLTTELNLNAYTTPVSAEMINKLIINIRDEVTRCRQCYNDIFSRFNLDVGELAVVTLYDLLMVDVLNVCQLAAEQEQSFGHIDQDLLALAYKLSQLDQEWSAYILPHSQQWRQPLMEQTRMWLSHLTRDLTAMVLNSTNKDKFTVLELPAGSMHVLPSPPSMGPHLSGRVCQSPRSAFSSLRVKGQQATLPLTSTPQRTSHKGAEKSQELQIEVEVHRHPSPALSPMNLIHSLSHTNTGGTQVPVEETSEDKNDLLKRELLQDNRKRLTRTSSAPDLTWFEEAGSLDKANPTLHPTFTQSQSVQEATSENQQKLAKTGHHRRSTGPSFSSSSDSGFKDKFSSQEDFEQDPETVEDRKSWRRSWHGCGKRNEDGTLGDVGICVEEDVEDEHGIKTDDKIVEEDTEDDQLAVETVSDNKNDSFCELNNNESSEISQDDLNTSQKDIVEQIVAIHSAKLDSTNTKDQAVSCDLSHDLSSDNMPSSKVNSQVDSVKGQLSVDSGLLVVPTLAAIVENEISHWQGAEKILSNIYINQYIDHVKTQDVPIDDEQKQSTRDFPPTQEHNVSINEQDNLPNKTLPAADSVQDVFDRKSSTPVVAETLPNINAAKNAPIKSETREMPCIEAVDVRNNKLEHEDGIPSRTDVPAGTVPSNQIIQTGESLMNDEEIEHPKNRPSIKSRTICRAASDLASYMPADGSFAHEQLSQLPPVVSKTHRHSIGYVTYGIANEQYQPSPYSAIPSLHSKSVQYRSNKSLEDSITASLTMSSSGHSDDEDQTHLPVSCSVIDVLVMVQQMMSFVSELCVILCPLPGSKQQVEAKDVPGPSGEACSAVLCRDRAVRMRGELLNNITQTMANTLGLYVQNLLAIDACGTLRDEAHRLLTKQITEDLEERRRLNQLGRCRHDRAGIHNCNVYLYKDAEMLCDRFEPITKEMCVRINNTWCLSCLVPHMQGLLPKGLLQQNLQEGSEVMDDLTFDLTPHNDVQYISSVMDTQIQLLAHKLNLFLGQGLEVLMSDEMPGCCMAVRLQPITECLTNHLDAIKTWLYPKCFQLFTTALWHLMIKNFENQVHKLTRYHEAADQKALLLLQGLTHLIEFLHNAGQGLGIDDLVEPAEPVLQLLQLFTLSTKRLIQLHKKLFRERCITTNLAGPSGGLTDVMSVDKLHKMFNELHKKRKCFTGECLMDWIQRNCVDPDQDDVNCSEQAADIAEKLLEIGVISSVTRTGETPNIKPGDYQSKTRCRNSGSQSEGGTDVEFPPVTLHSTTNSGFWRDSDTSDVERSRTDPHHHGGRTNTPHIHGVRSPYSDVGSSMSRSSSVSSLCIFRPSRTHYYCFTDIDDEVFYGVGTRVVSPTPSLSLLAEGANRNNDIPETSSFYDDKHLKVMSVTPEFVLRIIYARRKKTMEALKYVQGLPAEVVLGIEGPVSSWFCLSVCQ